jgi:hypothetical protein
VRGLLACLVAAASVVAAGSGCQAPPPQQPLVFSHRVHAGDNRIGCTSCHAYAEHSPVAGIPSMGRCKGCHKFVKEDPKSPKLTEEIKPLLAKLADDAVIEWVRVYRVPDHVYFTHQRHVAAGLRCQECHGPVETMEVMRQVAPLTMAWCLECHRRKISEQPQGRQQLTDCWTCHK